MLTVAFVVSSISLLHTLNNMHQEMRQIRRKLEELGISRFKLYNGLTSDLPINCITAVILVIICTRTPRLPEYNKSSLANTEREDFIIIIKGNRSS